MSDEQRRDEPGPASLRQSRSQGSRTPKPEAERTSQIVSHELSLDDAVRAYDQFDKRADGWTKVLLLSGKNS